MFLRLLISLSHFVFGGLLTPPLPFPHCLIAPSFSPSLSSCLDPYPLPCFPSASSLPVSLSPSFSPTWRKQDNVKVGGERQGLLASTGLLCRGLRKPVGASQVTPGASCLCGQRPLKEHGPKELRFLLHPMPCLGPVPLRDLSGNIPCYRLRNERPEGSSDMLRAMQLVNR